jgi:hypothetical protein
MNTESQIKSHKVIFSKSKDVEQEGREHGGVHQVPHPDRDQTTPITHHHHWWVLTHGGTRRPFEKSSLHNFFTDTTCVEGLECAAPLSPMSLLIPIVIQQRRRCIPWSISSSILSSGEVNQDQGDGRRMQFYSWLLFRCLWFSARGLAPSNRIAFFRTNTTC